MNKLKQENCMVFTSADKHDIDHVLDSKQYAFGNSDNANLPKRMYNKVIIKSADGSGRNIIGYLNSITEFDFNNKNQYWMDVRCKRSLNWKGLLTLDKVMEVSDEQLSIISDTMVKLKNKNK